MYWNLNDYKILETNRPVFGIPLVTVLYWKGQKTCSHPNRKTQSECHVIFACNENSENSLFSSHFPMPGSYWNLYIPYGHNFNIEWSLRIMYWILNPSKTSNSTHHKYGHFYWKMSRDFQQCSTIAKHIITVTFCFGPYNLKSRSFLEGESKKLNIMKTLSFNTFFCSRPCLPSEIVGIKAVLVAFSYVFPNSESVNSYKKREQDTKTALR